MADNRTPAQKAAEAAALLEKVAPYFDLIEAEAMEAAVSAEYWQPEGRRTALHHLDSAKAVRAVRQRLKTIVDLGALDAKRASV